MKKSLFVLGMAVAALASCTNEEVTEFAQDRAIGFNAFANNSTKADITGTGDATNFNKFYVFGDTQASGGSWENVFTGTEVAWETSEWNVQKDAYWVTGNAYEFAAYSDGNTSVSGTTTASFDPAQKKLSFTGYTAGDKDLVGALASVTSAGADEGDVALTFNHLLSKVQFTFTTDATEDMTIKINSIKFTAVKTHKCDYTSTGADWSTTGGTNGEYSYAVTNLTDIAATATDPFTTAMYVIPQSCASLEATINLDITGAGITEVVGKGKEVKASLAFTKGSGQGTDNTWEDGLVYNYIAKIDPAAIISGLKRIDFTANVENFTSTADQTPTIPTPSN